MAEPPATESVPPDDKPNEEAIQYWGYLFKDDKCGTATLNNLLRGIANYVATTLSPSPCQDLLPSQLADFYKSVGGNYDSLFLETPHSTLSFIYKSLGALHSLQPAEDDDGYAGPSVPALQHKGFITWQTIQLLLGPEEHVPFLQRAVERLDIINPEDGKPFPKVLPGEAFPTKPDPEMVSWFDEVNERLTQEAHLEQRGPPPATGPGAADPAADSMTDDSADERSGAAKYFSNPLYRDGTGRPTVVRRYSKQRAYSPQRTLFERGKGMVRGVRHFINPPHRDAGPSGNRRGSYPDRLVKQDVPYEPAEYSVMQPPNTLRPDYIPPVERAALRAAQRRARTPSTGTETDSDVSPRSSRRPSDATPLGGASRPSPSQKRADDLRPGSRDYFPARYPAERRRHSAHPPSPGPGPHGDSALDAVGGAGFMPSESPLFATQVAQSHSRRPSREETQPRVPTDARDRYAYDYELDEREGRDRRGSGGRPFTARQSSPYSSGPFDLGGRDRDRDRDRDRARLPPAPGQRPPPAGRYAGPANPADRVPNLAEPYRVQSEQQPRRAGRDRYADSRDRDGRGGGASRRSRSQPHQEEKPKAPRYVTPVDGVGGRRYVSPVWGDRWESPGAVGGDARPEAGGRPLHRVGFADGS